MPAYIGPNMEPMINDSIYPTQPCYPSNATQKPINAAFEYRFNTVPRSAQLRNMSMPYAMSPMKEMCHQMWAVMYGYNAQKRGVMVDGAKQERVHCQTIFGDIQRAIVSP